MVTESHGIGSKECDIGSEQIFRKSIQQRSAERPGSTSRARQPQEKPTTANKYAHPGLELY